MSQTRRLYACWFNMKSRCFNPNNKYYFSYGGRGINICDEWANDFSAFREWAFANGYSDNLSIDRINNDMGYSPDNCRWATKKQQSLNRKYCTYPNAGICKLPSGNYRAKVHRDGKYFHVGVYKTAEEARQARKEFIRRNNL